MKIETHLKLWLREQIDNWQYIDSILFLIILLLSTGFTNPCEMCKVDLGYGQMSCADAFLNKIGYEDTGGIVVKKEYNFTNLTFEIPES